MPDPFGVSCVCSPSTSNPVPRRDDPTPDFPVTASGRRRCSVSPCAHRLLKRVRRASRAAAGIAIPFKVPFACRIAGLPTRASAEDACSSSAVLPWCCWRARGRSRSWSRPPPRNSSTKAVNATSYSRRHRRTGRARWQRLAGWSTRPHVNPWGRALLHIVSNAHRSVRTVSVEAWWRSSGFGGGAGHRQSTTVSGWCE